MDETPRQRLARLMVGAPANSSPMPNFAAGAAPNMTPMPNFAAGANPNMTPMPNFAARLPPMPPEWSQGAPPLRQDPPQMQPPPQYAAPMPQQPMQAGGQGWGGPEPAPGTIPAEYDAMLDPRYLPEQWRGSFTGSS